MGPRKIVNKKKKTPKNQLKVKPPPPRGIDICNQKESHSEGGGVLFSVSSQRNGGKGRKSRKGKPFGG